MLTKEVYQLPHNCDLKESVWCPHQLNLISEVTPKHFQYKEILTSLRPMLGTTLP